MLVRASRMLMRNVSADFCASAGAAPAASSDENSSAAPNLLRPCIVAVPSTLGGQMTLYHCPGRADHGLRRRAAAAFDGDAAARMEAAPRRNIGGIRQRLAEADVRHAATRFRRQHTSEQRLRIGVARRPE